MRRTLRENKNGDYNLYWETEIEGLASTDFFKDARDFKLKAISFCKFIDKSIIRLWPENKNNFYSELYDSPFPSGIIFVAKEVQL